VCTEARDGHQRVRNARVVATPATPARAPRAECGNDITLDGPKWLMTAMQSIYV